MPPVLQIKNLNDEVRKKFDEFQLSLKTKANPRVSQAVAFEKIMELAFSDTGNQKEIETLRAINLELNEANKALVIKIENAESTIEQMHYEPLKNTGALHEETIKALEESRDEFAKIAADRLIEIQTLKSSSPTAQLKPGEKIISEQQLIEIFGKSWNPELDFEDNFMLFIQNKIIESNPEILKKAEEVFNENEALKKQIEKVKPPELQRAQFIVEPTEEVERKIKQHIKKLIDEGLVKSNDKMLIVINDMANLCINKYLTLKYEQ